jgi:hypothetical protein
MLNFTFEELSNARRAVLSLRNKSDKASGKLKDETRQYKLTRSNVAACDLALRLMDGDTNAISRGELDEAHKTLTNTLGRAESVIGKFAEGTSQHTLQKNRIAALRIALALIEREQNEPFRHGRTG